MNICFRPEDNLEREYKYAECVANMRHGRDVYLPAKPFVSTMAYQLPKAERHVSVGRWKEREKEGDCAVPVWYLEPEAGDLLDNAKAMRDLLAVMEGYYTLEGMHVVYSGNKSLWLGVPSYLLGNPTGSARDMRTLAIRLFSELFESEYDEQLLSPNCLHRCIGSRHARGGHATVISAEKFDLSIVNRKPSGPENLAHLTNPYLKPPHEKLYDMAKKKTEFHVPSQRETSSNIEGAGFMNRTENGVGKGARNWTAFRRACVHFDQEGLTKTEVLERLVDWNERCDPPMPRREVITCLESAHKTINRKTSIR